MEEALGYTRVRPPSIRGNRDRCPSKSQIYATHREPFLQVEGSQLERQESERRAVKMKGECCSRPSLLAGLMPAGLFAARLQKETGRTEVRRTDLAPASGLPCSEGTGNLALMSS